MVTRHGDHLAFADHIIRQGGATIPREIIHDPSVLGGIGAIDSDDAGVRIRLIQDIERGFSGIASKRLVVEVWVQGDKGRLPQSAVP